MAEYDAENIFAQILDKKAPCFIVYETKTTLAILDVFPQAEGHTLVMPKLKGHADLLSMPPAKAAAFLGDVQRVARAVQKATGAPGVNIISNSGADAGQTVFHPHFHIIPRTSGDGFVSFPPNKGKLAAEAATPVQEKIVAALNPPAQQKKAKFGKVSNIKPDSAGLNLLLKVVGEQMVVETKAGKFFEVQCGDASGTIVVSFREQQKDIAGKGAIIAVRNGGAKMINSHVRLAVDKWGKIEASEEAFEGEVEMDEEKNISATEYELVKGGK